MANKAAARSKLVKFSPAGAETVRLELPGTRTRNSLTLPESLPCNDWIAVGQMLSEVEGAVAWWIGDWWAFGGGREWGEGPALAEAAGINYQTARIYGSVAQAFQLFSRLNNLSFTHHQEAMAAPPEEREWWLGRALQGNDGKPWSANQLRAAIKQGKAFERTREVELDAEKIGRFVVLYADPPWQYENPPMGGSNRSIENHYPTMSLDEICGLPVGGIAHDNSVLFMWATSPKLYECMKVLDAWGFTYRTDMVWIKDHIGMGYHFREQHECLLLGKRGELAPPAVEDRPSSVLQAPRREHSAKPAELYDIIDRMYPGIRKLELFRRDPGNGGPVRPLWNYWGNQA